MFADLSCREVITFSAMLRLPPDMQRRCENTPAKQALNVLACRRVMFSLCFSFLHPHILALPCGAPLASSLVICE